MRHAIPLESLGPQGGPMAEAVERCVHCGFCLAVCPTYLTLGEEMDSPRGRILLMKAALEEDVPVSEVLPHVDRCLGCLACVTACPSGVAYGDLLGPFRARTNEQRPRTLLDKAVRTLIHQTLPYPERFRLAATAGRLARPLAGLLPGPLGAMVHLLPTQLPPDESFPEVVPAQGTRRARVALLVGCVQQVLAPNINRATVEVLSRNGVEVVIPRGQGCCGALSMHDGEAEQARDLARRNFTAFDLDDVDALVTNAAGCGSGMHEYPLLFAGMPEEEIARRFADKVQDVSVFLDRLGMIAPPPLPEPVTVAYHDACHLAHAQGVKDEPRRLLMSIPNLTLVPLPESDLCCGSAGTYNIEQPELAAQLGRRKAEAVRSTGADMVVAGNIGCLAQIEAHLRQLDGRTRVMHTVEVLAKAWAGSERSAP